MEDSNYQSGSDDSDADTIVRDRTKKNTKHPVQYNVVLINDDYTSMDFVVAILETVFRRTPSEAVKIMHKIHISGRGIAGVYGKEIAEAKLAIVHQRAQAAAFPLRGILEEV